LHKSYGYRRFFLMVQLYHLCCIDYRRKMNAVNHMIQPSQPPTVPAFCLPSLFTISQLKQVIETIIGKSVQRKSLMRRVEASDMFEEVDEKAVTGKRQAQLYKLKSGVNIVNFERNLSV